MTTGDQERLNQILGWLCRKWYIPTDTRPDVWQEGALGWLRAAQRFDAAKGTIGAYCGRRAEGAMRDYIITSLRKKRKTPVQLVPLLEADQWPCHDPSNLIDETIDRQKRLRRLCGLLGCLPPRQRQVIESLRKSDNLTAIGRDLGIGVSAVSQLRAKAITHMRELIEGDAA